MDYQEAIEVLNNHERYVGVKYVNGVEEAYVTPYFEKALDTAISAMEDLQQYEKIGTLEEVREAVERNKEKKVIEMVLGVHGIFDMGKSYNCPTCGSGLRYRY